jgi:lipopolysaccharide export system protein LptC
MDDERATGSKPQEDDQDSVLAAASAGMEDPEQTARPRNFEPVGPNYHKLKRKFHPFLIIVLLLLLAVGAIYWFMIRAQPAKAPTKKTAGSSQTSSSTANLSTTHYDSSNFNLGFDYPKSWKVSDTSGSGKLTVTSPAMKLIDSDNQKVDGQIVMAIRDKTQKLSEFDKGNAAAILDSEKITYTKPSETQRGNTYISFLNYASSTGSNAAGIDGIYVTGDAGYQKDQAVPAADISKIDPVTDVTFVKCSDSQCTGTGLALTLDVSNWQDSSFSKPIKTMLQSMNIQ